MKYLRDMVTPRVDRFGWDKTQARDTSRVRAVYRKCPHLDVDGPSLMSVRSRDKFLGANVGG